MVRITYHPIDDDAGLHDDLVGALKAVVGKVALQRSDESATIRSPAAWRRRRPNHRLRALPSNSIPSKRRCAYSSFPRYLMGRAFVALKGAADDVAREDYLPITRRRPRCSRRRRNACRPRC